MQVLRYVLNNNSLFKSYLRGDIPTLNDIKTQAFIKERSQGHQKPDHFYKNTFERHLNGVSSISELLLVTFDSFNENYFESSTKGLFVKTDALEEWQAEISRLTTLPFIAYGLWKRFGTPRTLEPKDIQKYVIASKVNNFLHSTLLTCQSIDLDHVSKRTPLNDLHIHLNGTTEADKVWLHTMRALREFSSYFLASQANKITKEMLLQIDSTLNHSNFVAELRVLRRARIAIARRAMKPKTKLFFSYFSVDYGLKLKVNGELDENHFDMSRHPFASAIPEIATSNSQYQSEYDTIREIIMWIQCFNLISKGDNSLAKFCHFYLLGQNSRFMPMCVQSAEHVGFDQFQKFTMNEVRELSEKHYTARFHQLSREEPSEIGVIEGRIAPKSRKYKVVKLLNSIFNGYRDYLNVINKASNNNNLASKPVNIFAENQFQSKGSGLRLNIIIHFIKLEDGKKSEHSLTYRHYKLRHEHQKQWQIFKSILNGSKLIREHFTGIDAAANELHAPPEVFAPLFRQCANDGYENFTFHVGEDFSNLISGVRAVAEAVQFLPMSSGCRLGHATAIGILPSLWLWLHKGSVTVKKGDLFDDLVFARVNLQGFPEFAHLIELIDTKIYALAQQLLPAKLSTLPIPLYYAAWELRKLDPELINVINRNKRLRPSLLEQKNMEWRNLMKAKAENPLAFDVFTHYHSYKYFSKSSELTSVMADFIPEKALIKLQQIVQHQLNKREIVIEVLPTSNVRISHYKYYREHHIYRWLKPAPESGDQRMSVVLGSDDPGIFATSIRNEFLHVQRIFRELGCSKTEVNEITSELIANGSKYVFRL